MGRGFIPTASKSGSYQDLHFPFPATSQYTPRGLPWGRFFTPSIPSDSGRTGRGQPCLFRVRENQKSLPFQTISWTPVRPLLLLRPVWFPFAATTFGRRRPERRSFDFKPASPCRVTTSPTWTRCFGPRPFREPPAPRGSFPPDITEPLCAGPPTDGSECGSESTAAPPPRGARPLSSLAQLSRC